MKEYRRKNEETKDQSSYECMCPKEDKDILVSWIKKQIDAVDHSCEKKYTVVENMEIYRDSQSIGHTERDTHQSCIEEDSRADIDRLFEGFIFRGFRLQEFGTTEDIERWNNLWDKNHINKNNHPHLYRAIKEKENTRKNGVYQSDEQKHGKIIQSRPELQEQENSSQ